MQLILDALTLSDWQLKAAKKRAEERRNRQTAIEEEIQSMNDALKTKLLFLLFLVVNKEKMEGLPDNGENLAQRPSHSKDCLG